MQHGLRLFPKSLRSGLLRGRTSQLFLSLPRRMPFRWIRQRTSCKILALNHFLPTAKVISCQIVVSLRRTIQTAVAFDSTRHWMEQVPIHRSTAEQLADTARLTALPYFTCTLLLWPSPNYWVQRGASATSSSASAVSTRWINRSPSVWAPCSSVFLHLFRVP